MNLLIIFCTCEDLLGFEMFGVTFSEATLGKTCIVIHLDINVRWKLEGGVIENSAVFFLQNIWQMA